MSNKEDISYQLARLEWAAGLNEMNVRALAADYLRGARDHCSIDAYREYERRFGKLDQVKHKRPRAGKYAKRSKGSTDQ